MSQMQPKPSKQDHFLQIAVPFVLLGFTAISFVAAILCCLFLFLVIANWSKNSESDFVLILQLIPTFLFAGGVFGFLTLCIKYLSSIAQTSARSAEALTKIVESQTRKKSQ
jgi:phosphate starvation-inducible membrane PsiE